jgi:riboflavin kinase
MDACKHILVGDVLHGDARGRKLGFPTANLALADSDVADGVWAALAGVGGEPPDRPTVVSIGRRPTFYTDDADRLLEAHILDFDGDIYGKEMKVLLFELLRAQRTFASPGELIEQIAADTAATYAWARNHKKS